MQKDAEDCSVTNMSSSAEPRLTELSRLLCLAASDWELLPFHVSWECLFLFKSPIFWLKFHPRNVKLGYFDHRPLLLMIYFKFEMNILSLLFSVKQSGVKLETFVIYQDNWK